MLIKAYSTSYSSPSSQYQNIHFHHTHFTLIFTQFVPVSRPKIKYLKLQIMWGIAYSGQPSISMILSDKVRIHEVLLLKPLVEYSPSVAIKPQPLQCLQTKPYVIFEYLISPSCMPCIYAISLYIVLFWKRKWYFRGSTCTLIAVLYMENT